jgi:hypothetical protein
MKKLWYKGYIYDIEPLQKLLKRVKISRYSHLQ